MEDSIDTKRSRIANQSMVIQDLFSSKIRYADGAEHRYARVVEITDADHHHTSFYSELSVLRYVFRLGSICATIVTVEQ